MPRFQRPKFDIRELCRLRTREAKSRLLFDWWCDEDDRAAFLKNLRGRVYIVRSRAHVQDDPAPPRSVPAPQGHARVALISDPGHVARVLTAPRDFSNVPYAELGGASFMLAIDPGAGFGGADWHARQRAVAGEVLGRYAPRQLETAAAKVLEQAEILSLAAPVFDLAEFAEQAALRYLGVLFGYSSADHGMLEEAARRGYRALQYVIVGRHFASEPGTIPAAQQALARLATRTSALIDEYATLARAPRAPVPPATEDSNATWPAGVQPWHELGLSGVGVPALRLLPKLAGELSGQDLCSLVGGLLVGTVGNVQTSVCLMVESLLRNPAEFGRLQALDRGGLLPEVRRLLAESPPVRFLPRRTGAATVRLGLARIPPHTDCIVVISGSRRAECPWGGVPGQRATHECLGRAFIEPLLVAILQRVLALPDLEPMLDGVTGEPLAPERLWGMGCMRYGLRYRRDKVRVQQPLIVVMPVRAPVAENAERLRRMIRSAAPRIEWLLKDAGMVHVAWFEFMEGETQLALRTVYDGDLDAYLLHFALRAGEVFDLLFSAIEGGPPLPVAEHPYEFVDTIRRFNRAPLGGYFYCAYPRTPLNAIARRFP